MIYELTDTEFPIIFKPGSDGKNIEFRLEYLTDAPTIEAVALYAADLCDETAEEPALVHRTSLQDICDYIVEGHRLNANPTKINIDGRPEIDALRAALAAVIKHIDALEYE